MAEASYTSLVSRYFEDLMNAGHLAVADEILTPDLAFHGTQTIHGVEPFKQFVTIIRTAFPDTHLAVEDTFGEGDKAVGRTVYLAWDTSAGISGHRCDQ
jgi:predicted SnoaL-like aldol condensation-catalyzing enzyme